MGFCAGTLYGSGHDQMRIKNTGDRHPDPADPFHDAGVGRGCQPKSAPFFTNGGAEQTEFRHFANNVLRPDIKGFQLMGIGSDVADKEALDGIQNQSLLFDALFKRTAGLVGSNGCGH